LDQFFRALFQTQESITKIKKNLLASEEKQISLKETLLKLGQEENFLL